MSSDAKLKEGSYIYFALEDKNYYGYVDEISTLDHVGIYYLEASELDSMRLYDFMFRTSDTEYEYFNKDEFQNFVVYEPCFIRVEDARQLAGGRKSLRDYMSESGTVTLPCAFRTRSSIGSGPIVILRKLDKCLSADVAVDGLRDFIEYVYLLKELREKFVFLDDEKPSFLSDVCSFRTKTLPFTDGMVLTHVIDAVSSKPSELTVDDLSEIKDYLEKYIESKGKKLSDRDFTDRTKEEFIEECYEDIGLDDITYEEIIEYRQIVNELCDKGSPKALKQKAYGCYGEGNRAFETDWETSLECLLELYRIDGDPYIANTLGYMYYYGRTTNGVPQYDKARDYFTVGAFAGYYQSTYKMGDIYAKGLGVRKQPYIAYRLYSDVYNSTYDDFRQMRFDYEFADAALRVGNCYKDGIGVDADLMSAYRYYLEAECAVKKRIEYRDNFGDKKVLENIQEGLKFCEDKLGEEVDPDISIYKKETPWLMALASIGTRRVEAYYKRIGADRIKFTIALLEADGTRVDTSLLVTVPEIAFCKLMPEPVLYADGTKSFWCMNPDHFVYNQVHFNDSLDRFEFTMYDELVAAVSADVFTFYTGRRAGSEKN